MVSPAQHLYRFDGFCLNATTRVLLRDGDPVPLTPKAFETLLILVSKRGRVVRKEELLNSVWPDTFVEEATLAQNVFTLRKALGEDESCKYIETVPKRGYRFVAAVNERAAVPRNEASALPGRVPSRRAAVLAATIALVTVAAAYWMFNGRDKPAEPVISQRGVGCSHVENAPLVRR